MNNPFEELDKQIEEMTKHRDLVDSYLRVLTGIRGAMSTFYADATLVTGQAEALLGKEGQ